MKMQVDNEAIENFVTNICHQYDYAWGDTEKGFAESDFVFGDVFTRPEEIGTRET